MEDPIEDEKGGQSLSYNDASRYINHASRNLRIATQTLIDYPDATEEVAILLSRAWRSLACLFAELEDKNKDSVEDLTDNIPSELVSFPKGLNYESWRKDLLGFQDIAQSSSGMESPSAELNEGILQLHCNVLHFAIRLARNKIRHHFNVPLIPRKLQWSVSTLVLILGIGYGVYYSLRAPDPWRVERFPNADLRGRPVEILRERNLKFTLTDKDWFSDRWDSCLRIEQPAEVTFELGSDDGSRLYVNDKQLIDAWKPQPFSAEHATIRLSRGLHHIRVEYFQHAGQAALSLKARFGKGSFDELSPSQLIYPGRLLRSGSPCTHLEK